MFEGFYHCGVFSNDCTPGLHALQGDNATMTGLSIPRVQHRTEFVKDGWHSRSSCHKPVGNMPNTWPLEFMWPAAVAASLTLLELTVQLYLQ